MPVLDISHESLNDMFVKACKQVFNDMLAEDIELTYSGYLDENTGHEHTLPSAYGIADKMRGVRINFEGDFNGELLLYFNYEQALAITRKFFEMNECEMDDEDLIDNIPEILGELSNMTAGLFKGGLLKTKLKCLLGLPSHMTDEWAEIEQGTPLTFRNICTFSLFDDNMMADVIIYA